MKLKQTPETSKSSKKWHLSVAKFELELLGKPNLSIWFNLSHWDLIPWWHIREANFSYSIVDFEFAFLCFAGNYRLKN